MKTILDQRYHAKHVMRYANKSRLWARSMPNMEMSYQSKPQNRIIIGTSEPNGKGDIISIPKVDDTGYPMRLSVLILGRPGAGKTLLTKFIIGQVRLLGENIAVVCDPKGEFLCCTEKPPLNPKLPKGYYPLTLPIKFYIPEYVIGARSIMPEGLKQEYVFNFKLGDLEVNDLKTLLGIREDTLDQTMANQSLLLDASWMDMQKTLGKKYPERTIDDLIKAIQSQPDQWKGEGFSARVTRSKLLGKINVLKSQKVFGNKGINIVKDIQEGFVPVLSNKFSINQNFDRTYASIFMRKLFHARMEEQITKNNWFFVDEFQTVASRGTSSLSVLVELVLRQGRQKLMHVIASTQTFNAYGNYQDSVPPEIISMFDSILMWKPTSEQDLQMICKARGIDQFDYRRKVLHNLHTDPKRGVMQAALISSDGTIKTFYPYKMLLIQHIREGQ